jgi:hypothetical protein
MNNAVLAFCKKNEKMYFRANDLINDIEDCVTTHCSIYRIEERDALHRDATESMFDNIKCAIINSTHFNGLVDCVYATDTIDAAAESAISIIRGMAGMRLQFVSGHKMFPEIEDFLIFTELNTL